MILRNLRAFCLALLLALPLFPLTLAAEDAQGPNYDEWTKTAQSTEEIVADTQASDTKLSELRAQMVKWRSTFVDAQGANADQIATVKTQIAALGDPPAEGATEDPAIAARRTELVDALSKLQAPGIAAGEAATRADGVIRNIDKIMRERQADKLLRLSPSGLNPVNWPSAGSMLGWMGQWIYDETRWRFAQPVNFRQLQANAPLIVALVVLSVILMLRGSRWMLKISQWLTGKSAFRGGTLISGFVSLGQVVLPVIGAVLLTNALRLTTLFGPIMTAFFQELPLLMLVTMAAWWLGARIFPAAPGVPSVLGFSDDGRAEGRLHTAIMGLALALQLLVGHWIAPRAEDYLGGSGRVASDKAQEIAARAEGAMSVLQLPLLLLAGVTLFRMGQLMRRQMAILQAQDDAAAFRINLMKWVANAVILIGVVGPVLGVIGYVAAANAIVWPTIVTLGVVAAIAVLQAYVGDLYAVLTRSEDRRGETLVPVLAGFGLSLGALPLVALVWGARPEDLAEMWTQFLNGFPVGGVRISPGVFLTFVIVFAIGYMLTRLVQGALRSTILPKTSLDRGGQNAIIAGAGYIGIFLAALLAISVAGINLSSLAIVAGALSVGVGFGLQTIVQNFVSGIILLVERPISEGDWINVGGQQGIVKSISVRSTRLQTFDRSEVVIPNASLITGSVTNLTRSNKHGRVIVKVGVAYGSDTRKVAAVLKEIAESHPLVMMNPGPSVFFTDFGADSMNFEIRAIISDVNFGTSVASEMNHQIAERFGNEGFEIPFAQRDLWLRNPGELAQMVTAEMQDGAVAPAGASDKAAPKGKDSAQKPEAVKPVAKPGSVGVLKGTSPVGQMRDTEGAGDTEVALSDNDGEEEGDRR